jgi:hypothetical protein
LQQAGQRQRPQADIRELAARFDAAGQRGDTVHQREQARFELWLRRDVPTGLALQELGGAKRTGRPAHLPRSGRPGARRRRAKPAADWIAAHAPRTSATRLLRQQSGVMMLTPLLFCCCAARCCPHGAQAQRQLPSLDRARRTDHGQWDIALRDLDYAIGLDQDGDGQLTWDEIRPPCRHRRLRWSACS